MNILAVILVSLITTIISNFIFLKLHGMFLDRWMQIFFDEETKRVKDYLTKDK